MKHTIAQDETLAVSASNTWSVNLPVVDDLYIRTTRTAAGNDSPLVRLGQIEVSVAITGPTGNKTLINGVPLLVLAHIADFYGGEAVNSTTDDHVTKIELGHIALHDGEELEIRLRNQHNTLTVIVDIMATCDTAGPTRILNYHQTQDRSKTVGDVLEIWAYDYTNTANVGDSLTSLEDNNSLVTVNGGRVQETNPIEMLEMLTRTNGEAEDWLGYVVQLYDHSENGGLPLNVTVDVVTTGLTGELRTLWVTEVEEEPASIAKRAKREKVEHRKSTLAVPAVRTASLRSKGLL